LLDTLAETGLTENTVVILWNENLANKPEHSAIVKELCAMLRANLKAKP